MSTMPRPTFPPANILALTVARRMYARGEMVTVTRTETGTIADWCFATVARIDGVACERSPGRRVRFQSADASSPVVALALALLDGNASTARKLASETPGLVMLSPSRCDAPKGDDGIPCGDVLSTPRSISEGRGPTCGGRYAAMRERADARRAAWLAAPMVATVVPPMMVAMVANRARCPGTCDPKAHCADCDGPR